MAAGFSYARYSIQKFYVLAMKAPFLIALHEKELKDFSIQRRV